MKETMIISSLLNSTEVQFAVEKHEQVMSKSNPEDKAIWHSMTIEAFVERNPEMVASLKFNTISAFDLEVMASCLSRLAAKMKTEQPIK